MTDTSPERFAMRKVLVTGAAGFIGSHLVERLVGMQCDVTAADRASSFALGNLSAVEAAIAIRPIDLLSDDIEGLLGQEQYDGIFHLAASAHVAASVDDPHRDFQRNTLATLNLLEAVRKASPHTALIYTSSVVVYEGGGSEDIHEDGPTVPRSPYGVSKLAAERYVNVYSRLYGLRTTVLRLFSVFGPRLRKQVIYDLMGHILDDPRSLTIQGTGQEKRDFSYIDDVVDAVLVVAGNAAFAGEAYNVASGEAVSTTMLARLIATTMGVDPELSFGGDANAGDTPHWYADTSRLRSLGHVPRVSLAEGIKRTWEWRKQSIDTSVSTLLTR